MPRTLNGCSGARPIDVVFLAMAVSDFEPEPIAGKLESESDVLVIRGLRAPKVIRSVRDWSPRVFLVGFKLLSRAEPSGADPSGRGGLPRQPGRHDGRQRPANPPRGAAHGPPRAARPPRRDPRPRR